MPITIVPKGKDKDKDKDKKPMKPMSYEKGGMVFKPCAKCPSPAKCRAMGKCALKAKK